MSSRDLYLWIAYGAVIAVFLFIFVRRFKGQQWFHGWLWRFVAFVGLWAGVLVFLVKVKHLDLLDVLLYGGLLACAGGAVFALLGPPKQHKPLRNTLLALFAAIGLVGEGARLLLRDSYMSGVALLAAGFILLRVFVKPRLKKLVAELGNTQEAGRHEN